MQALSKPKELTGRHVLVILLAFFGVMLGVNIIFTVMAVKTFRGEDVKRSYLQGINYNQILDQRASQVALDWSVSANIQDRARSSGKHLVIQMKDKDGQALNDVEITGLFSHRTDSRYDKIATFKASKNGRYTADLTGLDGPYTLKALAEKNGMQFRFEHAFKAP